MKVKVTTECGEKTCGACGCRAWNFTHTDWYCNLFEILLGGIDEPEDNALRCTECIEKFGSGEGVSGEDSNRD